MIAPVALDHVAGTSLFLSNGCDLGNHRHFFLLDEITNVWRLHAIVSVSIGARLRHEGRPHYLCSTCDGYTSSRTARLGDLLVEIAFEGRSHNIRTRANRLHAVRYLKQRVTSRENAHGNRWCRELPVRNSPSGSERCKTWGHVPELKDTGANWSALQSCTKCLGLSQKLRAVQLRHVSTQQQTLGLPFASGA